ncbi:kinase-like protein [Thelephora ganbajun]|uniref:Kinase-like protein n=1 Tax=Thelephora ganbajun TaxID=370292 RepID=A0ACB6Z940_THEGA|nr:kinase-like protein [Thelephora ganbajun]
MTRRARSSSIDDLTARLDRLRPDQDPDDLSDTLRAAFKEREQYKKYVSSLKGDTEKAKAFVKVFEKALTATTYDVTTLWQFGKLCGRTGILPASYVLPGKPIHMAEHLVSSDGFNKTKEGVYDNKRVAVKTLRVNKNANTRDIQKVTKVFCTRAVVWRRISGHPNIVPFLGVSKIPAFSMVSEWMPNGNVRDYVRENPEINRLQLLLDVSYGLSFLHHHDIVHGSLRGDNILVDGSGWARLNEFELTNIVSLNRTETSASGGKGTIRWVSAELINDEGKPGLRTCESDVFALGMVTLEVFTGQVPSLGDGEPTVTMKTMEGGRPLRPSNTARLGLSDELWEIIKSSLVHEAEERPPLNTFVDFLEKATPDISVLKGLTGFDANSRHDVQQLHSVFGYGDSTLLGMRDEETLVVIEVFDRVLNSPLDDSALRDRCLHGLQKVSARRGLLPKSYLISRSSLVEPDDASSTTGRVSTTRQWLIDGKLVVIKTISPHYIENSNAFKHRLCTSAVMWKRLQHPNVVSFLGFNPDFPSFSLVYPWMSNGNLSKYMYEHPDVDKLGLLLDVARGLAYLHQHNLVHGNLTGRNILVDSDGVACISEYGLEVVIRDEASSRSIPINVRWMAPEVLAKKNRRIPSGSGGRAADIYSFSMVMFKILTGVTPYGDKSDEEITGGVATGLRPEWPFNNPPQGLVNTLWEKIEACWNQKPKERPTVFKVLQTLLALGETQLQEPALLSVGGSDGKSTMRKWSDNPEESTSWDFVALRSHPGPDEERLTLFNKLCKTCSRQRLLPRSMHISDYSWDPMDNDCHGGHANVSQCTYKGRRVAVKVPRVYDTSDSDDILSKFCREAVAWNHLQHLNILPLLGVTLAEKRFTMVSEWMEAGNINDFIEKYPNENRIELLVDVAKGLTYMHSLHLVHGDLKGANILINKDRRACITDFGLSTITRVRTYVTDTASIFSMLSNDTVMSFTPGGTVRWMSPELHDPERFGIPESEGDRPTRQSDCYAFGMVIYEVLCGHVPYHDILRDTAVTLAILDGERPKKPKGGIYLGFAEALWETVEQCWLQDRSARPDVEEILCCLDSAQAFWYTRGRGEPSATWQKTYF